MTIRKALAASALAALIGGGMLAASTTEASARTVCNQWGRCWHERGYGYYGYRGDYYHSDYGDWRYRHRDYDRDYWRYHHRDYGRDYNRDYDRDRY
jgi:hypothetical protein